MGSFSNGTEGLTYQERYCERCRHWDEETGCPVWLIHELFNADQFKDKRIKDILTLLIPIQEDKVTNDKCSMFMSGGDIEGQQHLF